MANTKKISQKQQEILDYLKEEIFKSFNTKAGSVSDAGQCKYYKTVNLGFEETVRDVAEANFDADNYSSIEAYIDEIYEVNHIEEDDTFAGGKLLYIPYYGEIH